MRSAEKLLPVQVGSGPSFPTLTGNVPHFHSKLVSLPQGHQRHYLDSRIKPGELHKNPNPDVTNPTDLAELLLQMSCAVTEDEEGGTQREVLILSC